MKYCRRFVVYPIHSSCILYMCIIHSQQSRYSGVESSARVKTSAECKYDVLRCSQRHTIFCWLRKKTRPITYHKKERKKKNGEIPLNELQSWYTCACFWSVFPMAINSKKVYSKKKIDDHCGWEIPAKDRCTFCSNATGRNGKVMRKHSRLECV